MRKKGKHDFIAQFEDFDPYISDADYLKQIKQIRDAQDFLNQFDYYEIELKSGSNMYHWEGYAVDKEQAYKQAIHKATYLDKYDFEYNINMKPHEINKLKIKKIEKPTRMNLKKSWRWGFDCGVMLTIIGAAIFMLMVFHTR